MMDSKARGFSLMELMAVVIIIGIITAIALPMYQRYVDSTRLVQTRTLLTQVQQEIQTVKLREGSLGATPAAVKATVEGVLNSTANQSKRIESNLNNYYSFDVVTSGSNYFLNVTPNTTSSAKQGLYMDQSGNAFKCASKEAVESRATSCEKM